MHLFKKEIVRKSNLFPLICIACFVLGVLSILLVAFIANLADSNYSSSTIAVEPEYFNASSGAYQAKGLSEAVLSSDSFDTSLSYSYDSYDYDNEVLEESSSITDGRKLITTVHMTVETAEFDSFYDWISNEISNYGGYIESSDKFTNYNWILDLVIRIPSEHTNSFLNQIDSNSKEIRRSETTEDVTLNYTDTEIKKKALEAELDVLLELLSKAENLSDILSIQDRISTVKYMLELQESQLRMYDNQIDYSTIYLTVQEVKVYTQSEPETLLERISNGFVENLYSVEEFFENLIVLFVTHIPALVIFFVFVLFVFVIFKRIISFRKVKKQVTVVESSEDNISDV